MKKRFTEEQIIGGSDLLQLEGEVRRDDGLRGAAPEGA